MNYLRKLAVISIVLIPFSLARAQWVMQESHTTASLRGVHAVNDSIAWASGTDGTVLRTVDGGSHWQRCAVPPGGEKLDFRGVWAWDGKTAVVMSAGPEDLSRLYRTTDACEHWTEEARNTDKDGFWDAIAFSSADPHTGIILGDPIKGRFFMMTRSGSGWSVEPEACSARSGESAFAASNSSVFVFGPGEYVIGTGGKSGRRVLLSPRLAGIRECLAVSVPVGEESESAGVFSLAFRDAKHGIAVGGDYKKPADASGTSASTSDGGHHWTAATTPPNGYRSAVAWAAELKAWIAVGTNGSDISLDDGKTWRPLDNGSWNALSLPYVVGPSGRIGRLRENTVRIVEGR